MRGRLDAARFPAIFAGDLPVVHLRVTPRQMPFLPALLDDAFAAQPPLRLPGGDAWVGVATRALAAEQRGPRLSRNAPARMAGRAAQDGGAARPRLEPRRSLARGVGGRKRRGSGVLRRLGCGRCLAGGARRRCGGGCWAARAASADVPAPAPDPAADRGAAEVGRGRPRSEAAARAGRPCSIAPRRAAGRSEACRRRSEAEPAPVRRTPPVVEFASGGGLPPPPPPPARRSEAEPNGGWLREPRQPRRTSLRRRRLRRASASGAPPSPAAEAAVAAACAARRAVGGRGRAAGARGGRPRRAARARRRRAGLHASAAGAAPPLPEDAAGSLPARVGPGRLGRADRRCRHAVLQRGLHPLVARAGTGSASSLAALFRAASG